MRLFSDAVFSDSWAYLAYFYYNRLIPLAPVTIGNKRWVVNISLKLICLKLPRELGLNTTNDLGYSRYTNILLANTHRLTVGYVAGLQR